MRRLLTLTAWSFGLCVLLAGPTAAVPSEAAVNVTPVQLLSAGKAPRSTLRMAVADGTVAQGTMQMSESTVQSAGGKTINSSSPPPFTTAIRVTAGAASPTGNLPISYNYPSVGVVNDGSLSDAQVGQYQAALAPLAALTGTGTLTARNQIIDSTIAGTEGLDPTVAQVVSQVSNQLGAFSVPFPREAVGIGARWRGTSKLNVSGVEARQVIEYTMRAREGNQVTFDLKVTQTAALGTELSTAPKGTKIKVKSWKVLGTGTTTVSLLQPALPLTSMSHASGTQSFTVSSGGQAGTLNQKITTEVKVSP